MSGNSLLIDSNIILYLLNGDDTLIPILEEKELYISFITQLEVLSYHGLSDSEMKNAQDFINDCVIIEMAPYIKEYTIKFRRQKKLKLPDAIIAATSAFINVPLVTADKDFKRLEEELELIFYKK
ncbi:MAG: type II toxin-antitoxin system VapC family toxin [Bacteroidales bacterium]|nr:type II toxin-antitoxin system VapC family toxin [Bacteroidales bacterium]